MAVGSILLITGGGGGLGSLVAASEAANFSEIALLDRNQSKLKAAADKLKSVGDAKVHLLLADVCDQKQIQDVLSPFPSLDGLVNAAGVLGPVAAFGNEKWEDWANAIAVNLVGNVAVCKAALPALLKSRRGKIVNFSGGGAAGVRVYHSAYAASKAAMVKFTETIAAEYPGLDANAIAPGAHKTGIWDNETHDKEPEKWAEPERFCSLVSFLLSEKSDGITGKLIHIYDPWEKFEPGISKSEMYTLRRVEPKR